MPIGTAKKSAPAAIDSPAATTPEADGDVGGCGGEGGCNGGRGDDGGNGKLAFVVLFAAVAMRLKRELTRLDIGADVAPESVATSPARPKPA